jgi:hypothetical protein
MVESLRVKVREQAKTYEDYAKEFIELCHSKAGWDVRANYKQQKLVSVDVVSGLLDKAITEIEAKAFRHGMNYWENVVWFDNVRKILLGAEGETKK